MDKSIKLIKINKIEMDMEKKKETDFLDNLENYKKKIKISDLNEINNWDYYNKKNSFNLKKNNKNLKNKLIIKLKNVLHFLKYLKNYKNYKNKVNKINWKGYINVLKTINVKRLNLVKNNKFYKINKILYIIIDMTKLKTKAICFDNKKCLFYITNGLVFKKMKLKSKKNKKSEKTTNLVIKILSLKQNYFKSYSKIIIYTKGLKKNTQNIINFLSSKIDKRFNTTFINSYKFNTNKNFKFKKIKAIKRKLKKKFIKIK